MQLIEISPYIRFAAEVLVPRRSSAAYCTDCRLMLITEGNGKAYINKKGFDFSAGSLMLWQAGTRYRFSFTGEVKVLVIDFDLVSNGKNSPEILPLIPHLENGVFADYHFTDTAVLNAPLYFTGGFFAEKRINEIVNVFRRRTACSDAAASALLKLCIAEIAEATLKKSGEAQTAKAVDYIADYVQKNLKSDLSNEYLAEKVGYHPYYLNRIFKAAKGSSLHAFVLNSRLSSACELLLATSKKISEIAEDVGFNNQIAFINAFKKKYGLTPTNFRRKFYKNTV